MAAELPGPLREYWYDLNIELIAGQRADLTGAAEGRRDLGQAERVAQLKSGSYSVERPLQLGALAAGASARLREALAVYGRHVGRAFALRDDELGIWGDPVVTGKPAGDDLRSGKATVILALAQATLRGAPAAALTRIGTPATTEEDVALLQEALITSGVKGRVEAMIAEEVDLARAALRRSPFTPAGVAGLREMADRIAWRNA
ncbi:MAG: polyprenyl synthetase family protein [Micropruina sp.]|nr:polyprenyl synthetase family protein [Micropruina sp.]